MYKPEEIPADGGAPKVETDVESNTPTDGGPLPRESVEESSALRHKDKSPADVPTPIKRQISEEDEYGFMHPAASRPQRPIWIPSVGSGRDGRHTVTDAEGETTWESEEVQKLKEVGLDVSTDSAGIDGVKGRVDVWGPPPGTRGWEA